MNFDMGNLGGMLGMFQQRMEQFKQQAAAMRCEGQAGGGLVKVTVSGANECLKVEIAEGAMEDRELLEDLVRAATEDAMRQVKARTAENVKAITGGLPLPPGLLPF